jgi:hypothetical protein
MPTPLALSEEAGLEGFRDGKSNVEAISWTEFENVGRKGNRAVYTRSNPIM